jgi:outer membrane receptor protein involved in Fe transport
MESAPRASLPPRPLLGLLLCVAVGAARAAESPAAAGVAEVVVSAERPVVETSIDRKSYSLARDLQAAAGSAADVLGNLPSITVDLDGNPSLRGDANVQVLVDGRPSPLLNSANRGAALQQMNADSIERIEVLTNPPANFKPDGSAGIINIITKRKPGKTAAVQSSVGSGGRLNLGTTAGYQVGGLNLRGGVSVRRDIRERLATDSRASSDSAGAVVRSSLSSSDETERLSRLGLSFGADFDLTPLDRITAEATYSDRQGKEFADELDRTFDALDTPLTAYERELRGAERGIDRTAMLKYHRGPDRSGDGLTLLVQHSEDAETERVTYRNDYLLPVPDVSFDDEAQRETETSRELSAEYSARLGAGSRFILGYNLQLDDNDYDNSAARRSSATAAPVIDPAFTNHFLYGQTIHALYGSYQRPLGPWTVLAGLRLEEVSRDTDQITSGLQGSNSYFRVYPTVHFARDLSDNQSLSFSYSHRVVRPQAWQLNPYAVQRDAFTLEQGNPDLLPAQIHSLEFGWSNQLGSRSLSSTLFVRQAYDRSTEVTRQITPTLQLITRENLGKSLASGLEFSSSGRLVGPLEYSLSGTLGYNRTDAANLGYAEPKSRLGHDAKAMLNWRPTAQDSAQLNFRAVGKRDTPQGYRPAFATVDLGYRHQFRKNLALTATLSDLFESRRDGSVIDTPQLSGFNLREQSGRIAYVGLAWSLPGTKDRGADKFDYEE